MTIRKRRNLRRRRKLFVLAGASILAFGLIIVLGLSMFTSLGIGNGFLNNQETVEASTTADGSSVNKKPALTAKEREQEKLELRKELLTDADWLAAGYDHDGAIELIRTWEGFDQDSELTERIAAFEAAKATLVAVDVNEVTHVFYHSLIVDPEKAFANHESDKLIQGVNQWMTTIDEFNKITQEMYDRGFVLVSIHDLVNETTDENGKRTYEPGTILLPPGKKPFVLSIDDVNYYHAYESYGMASKLVLDKNGKVTNEYIQRDGAVVYGSYDVVPLLDDFIAKNPDASYKGARGIIALTGYNGILGYRSDESYALDWPDLSVDKKQFLLDHPDFDLEAERVEAKKVADAMKADGWEFATHTWGHQKAGSISLDHLKKDMDRWMKNVEPLVGPVDTIIFAHGEDFQGGGSYDKNEAKYKYFEELGIHIFCGVDSAQYSVRLGDDHLRMSRRNLDGYRIYFNTTGQMNNLSDLFDPKVIIDPLRPPVKPLT